MNATCLLPVDPDTHGALRAYLRDTGSDLSLVDAVALAIRGWIADSAEPGPRPAAPASAPAAPETPSHASARATAPCALGYQWKELFLPDGTDLRMNCMGATYHARVSGDTIVYQGRRVSARQLTIAIAGDGRNAWHELSLRLPGEQQFRPASLLRRQQQARVKAEFAAGGPAAPESPAAAIAAAAASMSDALRTALALVELNQAAPLPKQERRGDNARRESDILAAYAQLDGRLRWHTGAAGADVRSQHAEHARMGRLQRKAQPHRAEDSRPTAKKKEAAAPFSVQIMQQFKRAGRYPRNARCHPRPDNCRTALR